jgi:MFS family permease
MGLPSRRSLAEARIALGSFDRFLLLYGTMFAAFGVASPFLPALLHERGLGPSEIGAVLAAGTAVRLITGPVISRLADRLGKHRQILAVLLAMAAVIAFGYGLPAGFAIFLLVSVAHASALAPIVPIADAMTLAAAPGRFQYGWVRGAASAAFVVGAVGAGQFVGATSLGGIIWMNGTMLALAALAALRLPRNALDRPVARREANVRALFAVPGFLPLMALAALVLGSHALHDGFEVLRWQEGGIGPGAAGLLWSEGVLAEVGRFRGGGSNAPEAAWASRRGRAGCQRGNGPLERHRCHRLAPGNGARGTAAWSDIRPVAPCLHADAVCDYPAGPRCDRTGDIRRRRGRYDDRHNYTGVRSTLRGARPARVLGHGAALCRCVADRVCDAQDLDQCIRVECDLVGTSVVACQPPR